MVVSRVARRASPKAAACTSERPTTNDVLRSEPTRPLTCKLISVICRRILVSVLFGFSLLAASQTPAKPAHSAPKTAEKPQLYRNPTFGFRYETPYGWVDRTKDMHEQRTDSQPEKGEVLLANFERPPEAPGETVNSAVVIAAENTANYPGLKKPEDYVSSLIDLVTKIGFKQEGDPSYIDVDGRELIRADFSKPLNEKLTMRQSTLVLLSKGHIVTFTFIAGSSDELDNLIDRLHFAAKAAVH